MAHHESKELASGENAMVKMDKSNCAYVATRVPIPSMSGRPGSTPVSQIEDIEMR